MKKGKFITIDGGEGAGKTSILAYLKGILGEDDVVYTREPGGTVIGEEIRAVLLSKEFGSQMEIETKLLLFFASRIQHLKEIVVPALESGKHVICDRFDLSTYAYQIVGEERLDLEDSFCPLDLFARGGIVSDGEWVGHIEPDLYILLDVPPILGLNRVMERGEETTYFDDQALSFHERVADGLRHAASDKGHAVIIDAGQDLPEVKKEVIVHVKNILNMN